MARPLGTNAVTAESLSPWRWWHCRARVPVTVGVLPMPLWHHSGAIVVIMAVVVCQCRHGGGGVSSCQAQVVFFGRGVGITGGA